LPDGGWQIYPLGERWGWRSWCSTGEASGEALNEEVAAANARRELERLIREGRPPSST
jgi:hypothetical protein